MDDVLTQSAPTQGYWIRPNSAEGERFAHYLGGVNSLPGARCPNCNEPLILLVDFDATDARLELDAAQLRRLPLLYCWSCAIPESVFRYSLKGQGSAVNVLAFRSGEEVSDPYAEFSRVFARRAVGLIPLSVEEQQVLRLLNRTRSKYELFRQYPALDRPRHQVGGEPLLLQHVEPVACSTCGSAMPLFASIGNDSFGPKPFIGNDWVQVIFHVCRACREVAAYAATD